MSASLNDMAELATDPTFGDRVASALWEYCLTVNSEGAGVANHQVRKNYAAGILNNPGTYKPLFINVASVNAIVANEATQAGTASSFTASITGTVMTVSALTSGTLTSGQTITGTGVLSGTTILSQVSGSVGGTGAYTVSSSQTASSEAMTGGPTILTASNVATQAPNCVDGDIQNAVASAFNAFIVWI